MSTEQRCWNIFNCWLCKRNLLLNLAATDVSTGVRLNNLHIHVIVLLLHLSRQLMMLMQGSCSFESLEKMGLTWKRSDGPGNVASWRFGYSTLSPFFFYIYIWRRKEEKWETTEKVNNDPCFEKLWNIRRAFSRNVWKKGISLLLLGSGIWATVPAQILFCSFRDKKTLEIMCLKI